MPSAKTKAAADESPKVFDVARPGKSAPAASGKPVIVTNRPLLQDPMMVAAKEGSAPAPSDAPLRTGKVNIQPITIKTDDDTETTKPAATTPKPAEPAAAAEPTAAEPTAPAPEAEAQPAPEPAKEPAAATSKAPTEDKPAAVEKPAETEKPAEPDSEPAADEKKPKLSPEEQEAAAQETVKKQAEHDAAIQKLAEGKQYYLPINTAENRRMKQHMALGALLILLLAAAWLDIALDAGLIKLGGIKAVTHFFSH